MSGPLGMWTEPVLKLTRLSLVDDLLPSYEKVLAITDTLIYDGKLASDP